MKIGIIADGQAEIVALRELFARITVDGVTLCNPLYADMQPLSSPAQVFKAAEGKLAICSQRGCNRTIVLLDHEDRTDCPGIRATEITSIFSKNGHSSVSVVIKQRAFENWLIGDLDSVRKCGKRFNIRDGLIERVKKSGADSLSAIALLDGCVTDGYSKRRDAIQICKAICPLEVARNSRSFRKLLRACGHSKYLKQSKSPTP